MSDHATAQDIRGMLDILNTMHDLKQRLAVAESSLAEMIKQRDYFRDWVERMKHERSAVERTSSPE